MNRLGLPLVVVLSLAGCVEQKELGTSSDDVTLSSTGATTGVGPNCPYWDGGKGSSCVVPEVWDGSQTQIGQYWAGDGTTAPAKVMLWLETGALPDANGNPTAAYFWLIAGAPDGSNSVFKVYQVAKASIGGFQNALRWKWNAHEQEPGLLTSIWDGGAGGGLGGTPINPVGPRGFPALTYNAALNTAGNFRGSFFNFEQTSAEN